MVNRIFQDFRHACRLLKQRPQFSLLVILSLGIAIGSNAAILNLIHELFLRSLPIQEPHRMVAFYSTNPDFGGPLSFLNWQDVRQQSQTMSDVAAYEWTSLPVTLERGTTRLAAQLVSGNYFDALGVAAIAGRTFGPGADAIPGADLEVVVSHHFWQQYLGGDPGQIGRTLRISGQLFTIVGVAEPEFRGIDVGMQVELWIPFGVYRQIYSQEDWVWYEKRRGLLAYGIGRLKPGASLKQCQAELLSIAEALEAAYPEDNENQGIQAIPISQATIFPWARPFIRTGVMLLGGAVLITLLIASVNVANLLLARARERNRDVAIRLALGISRPGLMSRFMIESLILSLLGGLAGVWFLWLTQRALHQVIANVPSPTASPLDLGLGLDASVLAVTFFLALALGLLLGLFPALAALRGASWQSLKNRGQAGEGGSRRWSLRSGLLVAQLALSFLALLGGGLFFRSLHQIRSLDPGFETRRLAFMRLDLSAPRSSSSEPAQVRQRIVDAISSLAGVETIGASPRRPMDGGWKRPMAAAEFAGDPDRRIFPYTDRVNGEFFEAMGLALLEGRSFSRLEQEGSGQVAVVNQLLAQRLWPDQSPIGHSLVLFDLAGETPLEIVGVVETASYRRVTESPQPYVYMPLSLDHAGFLTLAIRTSGDPSGILPLAVAEVRQIDPLIPVMETQTVADVVSQSMWGPRLAAAFLGVFAVLALLLSAIGIYGVISFETSRRIREFCIRVAVGAQRSDIAALVVRQSGRHCLWGILLGIPLAYASSDWVSNLIFLDVLDPIAIAVSLLPLLLVAFVAALIPARRAIRADPIQVLRWE